MSLNKFTQEEIIKLKENKYTYVVTENTIKFTKEFKQLMYDKIQQGMMPTRILEECGYDIKVLGPRRPASIARHIMEEYKVDGEFHNGRKYVSIESEITSESVPPSKALLKMQAEITYLRQEVEFLKKILQEQK